MPTSELWLRLVPLVAEYSNKGVCGWPGLCWQLGCLSKTRGLRLFDTTELQDWMNSSTRWHAAVGWGAAPAAAPEQMLLKAHQPPSYCRFVHHHHLHHHDNSCVWPEPGSRVPDHHRPCSLHQNIRVWPVRRWNWFQILRQTLFSQVSWCDHAKVAFKKKIVTDYYMFLG